MYVTFQSGRLFFFLFINFSGVQHFSFEMDKNKRCSPFQQLQPSQSNNSNNKLNTKYKVCFELKWNEKKSKHLHRDERKKNNTKSLVCRWTDTWIVVARRYETIWNTVIVYSRGAEVVFTFAFVLVDFFFSSVFVSLLAIEK